MKEFDKIYIAKYHEKIGISEIAKGFCVPKTQVENVIKDLRRSGLYKIYKNMSDTEWEQLENKKDKAVREKYLKQTREINKNIFEEILETFKVNIHESIMQFPKYEYQKEDFDRDYMQKEDYEGEEWKKIFQFEYSISNYGRVRNDKNGKLKKIRYHKWIFQTDIYKNGKRYTINVPRLEAHLFIRKVLSSERVGFVNGDHRNLYYKNLKIVSK